MLSSPSYTSGEVVYQDAKRFGWLLSLMIPAIIASGPLFYWATGSALSLFIPALVTYVGIPLADLFVGLDEHNPPEEVVSQLDDDLYYRWVAYLLTAVLWVGFLFNIWFVGTYDLPWYGWLGVAAACGILCGGAINLGHELGHKTNRFEHGLGVFTLSMSAYGHFSVEHNRGHHRHVATPEDCASARMGETVYAFMLREIPGAFFRAWGLEKDRLQKRGLGAWSLHNEIVVAGLMSTALLIGATFVFGVAIVPFMLLAWFIGYQHLTFANYIEHYGLLRQKQADGKYERCEPRHSWNSNHLVSNFALLHLQRHSDHHANPARRYQTLRHFDALPTLPFGYPAMYIMSTIPPLFFRIMDPILVDHVARDARRVNFAPRKRSALINRYGLEGQSVQASRGAVQSA